MNFLFALTSFQLPRRNLLLVSPRSIFGSSVAQIRGRNKLLLVFFYSSLAERVALLSVPVFHEIPPPHPKLQCYKTQQKACFIPQYSLTVLKQTPDANTSAEAAGAFAKPEKKKK